MQRPTANEARDVMGMVHSKTTARSGGKCWEIFFKDGVERGKLYCFKLNNWCSPGQSPGWFPFEFSRGNAKQKQNRERELLPSCAFSSPFFQGVHPSALEPAGTGTFLFSFAAQRLASFRSFRVQSCSQSLPFSRSKLHLVTVTLANKLTHFSLFSSLSFPWVSAPLFASHLCSWTLGPYPPILLGSWQDFKGYPCPAL